MATKRQYDEDTVASESFQRLSFPARVWWHDYFNKLPTTAIGEFSLELMDQRYEGSKNLLKELQPFVTFDKKNQLYWIQDFFDSNHCHYVHNSAPPKYIKTLLQYQNSKLAHILSENLWNVAQRGELVRMTEALKMFAKQYPKIVEKWKKM